MFPRNINIIFTVKNMGTFTITIPIKKIHINHIIPATRMERESSFGIDTTITGDTYYIFAPAFLSNYIR